MVANISRTPLVPPATGYDEDLEHRLVNFLDARHVPEREAVHLDVHGGTVVVRGPLHSDHAKWLCLECCRHVAGVIKLVDEIVVELPPPPRTGRIRTQPPTRRVRSTGGPVSETPARCLG